MPFCDSDGVRINYEIEGSGPEVIMIHGFAADIESCWRITRVVDTLKDENRLVMMDCRGHGKSDKPTDPKMYGAKMVDDITNLMGHLGIEKANFIGYSMGSRLSLELLLAQPERFKSVILGGFGLADPASEARIERSDTISRAMQADSLNDVTDSVGQDFRRFAESTGGDLKALAACSMGWSANPGARTMDWETRLEKIRAISVPLLTVVGNDDNLVSNGAELAMMVKNGCHLQVQGKDHISVVAGTRFRMMVRAFLNFVNGS
jgi:pimeloyl-ACP methyl ester carboxylesterase